MCNLAQKKMGDFKLAYFDGRGRAEVLRLTLAAGGKKFEDCRWDGAQFQKEKDSELRHRFFLSSVLPTIASFSSFVGNNLVALTSLRNDFLGLFLRAYVCVCVCVCVCVRACVRVRACVCVRE